MKPVIEVKGLSKVYQIGHDDRPAAGSATFRDTLTNFAKKPIEIFTGHKIAQEEFWALKDVNFEVKQGDVVGIIGRNGSGKSTLLKVLSRIIEPSSGEITIRGNVASLLEVGTGFHPELTGRENIFFNGAILGMSQKEIRAKFDDIVEFSEVEKFLDTPVKFYSSGMYVRLAFSVAAHLDPDILIVDEVLAVGDAAFQKKCLGKMRDVAGEGRTVLFVSHSMSAVQSLCNKGILMEKGRISATGDIESVANEYVSSAHNISKNESLLSRRRNQDLSKEALVESILINGKKESDFHAFDPREPLKFDVGIKSEIDTTKRIAIHIVIQDSSGIIIRAHSEYSEMDYKLKKGSNRFICNLDPTYLLGGTYTVDCGLLYEGEDMKHIDLVTDAYLLNIKDLSIGESIHLSQKDAKVYINQRWE